MAGVSIQTEFDHEFDVGRARLIRRRVLWWCVVGTLLSLVIDGWSFFAFFGSDELSRATRAQRWGCAFDVAITVLAFWYAWKAPPRRDRLLRLAFVVVVLVGCTDLLIARLSAGVSPKNHADPGFAYARDALFLVIGEHVLACLFIRWTLWESLLPAAALLAFNAAIVFTDLSAGRVGTSGIVFLGLSPLCAVPGALICWWRFSRFHQAFRLQFESARYRLLQTELASARRLHESCLPPPTLDGPVRLSYVYQPMRQIGGDLLFVHKPPDDPQVLSVVVLDVTGHGIPAALTVNRMMGELERLFAESPDAAPAHILRALNRYIALTLSRHCIFATALCLRIDARTGELQWANGGHPPAFIRRAGGVIEQLDPTAPLLGAIDGEEFDDQAARSRLEAGDVVLAYTDGVSEACDQSGVQLGTKGVRGLVTEICDGESPADEWPAGMLRGVLSYRQTPVEDDTLLVAISLAQAAELEAPVAAGAALRSSS